MGIGPGGSNEAPFTLRGPIAAGTWHLVGDGEGIGAPVTEKFEILWRRAGAADTVIATVNHDFPVGTGSFRSVMFETDLAASAVPAAAGDQLVLRFTTVSASGMYTPNGDGATASARDPNLTLP
jgi:hypothetical protein